MCIYIHTHTVREDAYIDVIIIIIIIIGVFPAIFMEALHVIVAQISSSKLKGKKRTLLLRQCRCYRYLPDGLYLPDGRHRPFQLLVSTRAYRPIIQITYGQRESEARTIDSVPNEEETTRRYFRDIFLSNCVSRDQGCASSSLSLASASINRKNRFTQPFPRRYSCASTRLFSVRFFFFLLQRKVVKKIFKT